MIHRVLRGLAALLLLAAPAAASTPEPYLLRSGDVIQVTVLEDPSLDAQILIRPDGRISMPLVGTVMAAGETPEALQETLRANLTEEFIEPPTITVGLVSVAQGGPEAGMRPIIYVTGQVNAPGRFEVMGDVTVLQALAIAGGPGIYAATSRIQLRRRDPAGRETVTVFDYDALEEGAPGGEMVLVGDGDVIVVPERGLFD